MKSSIYQLAVAILVFISMTFSSSYAVQPDDSNALQGVATTKAIFDINFREPEKLELYLGVIEKTYHDLLRQDRQPEFIITFRGSSVRLITDDTGGFNEADQSHLHNGAAILETLSRQGVRLEACSIATNIFKIENKDLLTVVNPVGNTFVSLIGYQAKGYTLIPIQ